MKIQSVQTYNNVQNRNNVTKPVSFEGISPRMLYEYSGDVAGKLNVRRETISGIAATVTEKRRDFLSTLAQRYNEMYGENPNTSENPEFVLNIFKMIKRPSFEHSEIISKVRGSFKNLEKIFSLVKSKKDLKLISKLQEKVYQQHRIPENVLEGILESPNKKLYAKNLEDYKSYLLTHLTDKHAIQKLDNLVSNNAFDRKKYDSILYANRLLNTDYGSRMFRPFRQFIEENYSESGKAMLKRFFYEYATFMGHMEKVDVNDILNMYKTSNPNNIAIRLDLIDLVKRAGGKTPEFVADEVKTLSNIFNAMDENKDVLKFVKKVLEEPSSGISSAGDLGEVLEIVPIKMANTFTSNIFKIIRTTYNKEERILALQNEVQNSSYMTKSERIRRKNMIEYGYAAPESSFTRLGRTITNGLRKIKYHFVSEDRPLENIVSRYYRNTGSVNESNAVSTVANNAGKVAEQANNFVKSQAVEQVEEPVAETIAENVEEVLNPFIWDNTKALPFIPQKFNIRQGLENKFKLPELNIPQHLEENSVPFMWNDTKALPFIPQKQAAEIVSDEVELLTHTTESGLQLINKPKESAKARKLRVIGDVKEIISQKLGAKTLERQEELYSKNATKMRLNMLPEIFDSIKETRKIDRLVGKLKSQSSNKDAVELYSRINGNNRKLIRYMLMKRNVDGTRMFEVKEIVAFIDKANEKIAKAKQENPKFSAKDAKAYYKKLYQAKIEEYGKLKRVKKSKV